MREMSLGQMPLPETLAGDGERGGGVSKHQRVWMHHVRLR